MSSDVCKIRERSKALIKGAIKAGVFEKLDRAKEKAFEYGNKILESQAFVI